MKRILTILFTIITVSGFSQSTTVTVGDISGASVANSDSLGGMPPAYYIDTVSAQNITGLKTFDNLVADSIEVDSINISSRLILNGIAADSIIGLDQVTGNLANSTTRLDTVWSAVLDASDDASIGGDLAVTGDMSTVQWTTYGGTSTIVGWTSNTSTLINYKKVGNLVFVQFYIDGVSDATNVTFTLPFTQISTNGIELKVAIQVGDNSSPSTTSGLLTLSPNSATVSCFLDMAGATWTASNNKRVQGQFWYQAQ